MAAPVTNEAAVRSAIRQRLQEWVDGENALLAADGLPEMPVAWPGFSPEPEWTSARRAEVFIDLLEGRIDTTAGDPDDEGQLSQTISRGGTIRVLLRDQVGDGDGDLQEAAGRLTSFFTTWNYFSPQIELTSMPGAVTLPVDGAEMRVQWSVSFLALGNFAVRAG